MAVHYYFFLLEKSCKCKTLKRNLLIIGLLYRHKNGLKKQMLLALFQKRYGGTYAHKDIGLNFCYWLNPEFQVFMIKKFQELLEAEYSRQNLKWHISKITDNIEEVRNLLDTKSAERIK